METKKGATVTLKCLFFVSTYHKSINHQSPYGPMSTSYSKRSQKNLSHMRQWLYGTWLVILFPLFNFCELKSFGKKRYVNINHIRPVTDGHEVYFHMFEEAMTVSLSVERGDVNAHVYLVGQHLN